MNTSSQNEALRADVFLVEHGYAKSRTEAQSAIRSGQVRINGQWLAPPVFPSEPLDPARMLSLYEQRYAEEPFVEVTSEPPGVSGVRETNLCLIHLALNEASGRAMAFASIDNLWKGAAGQAIQNVNRALGLPDTAGLRLRGVLV